jgi:hypothetical protein
VPSQPLDVAGPGPAQGEVGAADQEAQVHACQHPGHELFGRQRRERPVELEDDGLLDAELAGELQALLQGGDHGRAVGGIQDAARVRVEGDHGPLQAALRGPLAQPAEDRLVTKVQPVEAPDGQPHRPQPLFGKTEVDSHQSERNKGVTREAGVTPAE